MNRKDFLHSAILLGAASFVANDANAASSLLDNPVDKLVDDKGNFILPPLPYRENALEPYMDEETVHLHYTFHHGGAVKGANKDMENIRAALDKQDLAYADYWTKKAAHHFSSHVLHSIFWTNLSPNKTEPSGELKKRIEKQFGSFDKFKGLIASVSKNVEGNGWGVLAYQPFTDSLTVIQCENHEKLVQWGAVPLFVIDVWEHAYYLKHKNKRDQFVDTIFSIANWDNVADRLNNAVKAR